jgi:abelson tyrosine-protein kinase 1
MSTQEPSRSSSSSSSSEDTSSKATPSFPFPVTSASVLQRSSLDRSSSSPRTPSPLNPQARSQSQSPSPTPPSRNPFLPTPSPPAAARVRLHSFNGRDPSPVRDALMIPISRVTSAPAIPQSSSGAASSSPLPAIVLDAPATAPPSVFRARSPSRARSQGPSPERGGEPETGTPPSTWWSHRIHPPRPWAEHPKRKRTLPSEQVEGYLHTRSVRKNASLVRSSLSLTLSARP